MTNLYQIRTSYFTCGIETDENDLIIDAAPILKWAIGKNLSFVKNWVYRKGGEVNKICKLEDPQRSLPL